MAKSSSRWAILLALACLLVQSAAPLLHGAAPQCGGGEAGALVAPSSPASPAHNAADCPVCRFIAAHRSILAGAEPSGVEPAGACGLSAPPADAHPPIACALATCSARAPPTAL